MVILGTLTSIDDLEDRGNGGGHSQPLKRVSIEGFSVLARPASVENAPTTGMVEAVVSVQWRSKGQRPIHWLDSIRAYSPVGVR